MYKETIYYMYRTDNSIEEHYVKVIENQNVRYKSYFKVDQKDLKEKEDIKIILEKVDEFALEKNAVKFKNDFQRECQKIIGEINTMRKDNITIISGVIQVLRFYKTKFSNENLKDILLLVKEILKKARIDVKKNSNHYQYFANNMIADNSFSKKYREEFLNLEKSYTPISPDFMQKYIDDYLLQLEENLRLKKNTDKDFSLRNIEVYLRIDIEGSITKEIKIKIIDILEVALKKYEE